MEAPDKIYVPKNVAPHLTEEWASHTHGSLDEYIRKDALLEWAEAGKKLLESEDAAAIDAKIRYGANVAYDELIRALNSL